MIINDHNREQTLKQLQQQIADAELKRAELDDTIYKDCDWNGASSSETNRLEIALMAVALKATEVNIYAAHGVIINNTLVVSPSGFKFRLVDKAKWYPITNLANLIAQHTYYA
ncbi:hypothetical protein BG58_11070 [Caballeronia jiangsuensis]|nr:hypothetical protein BG58_11070 [Caballeronia jiangsuensis]